LFTFPVDAARYRQQALLNKQSHATNHPSHTTHPHHLRAPPLDSFKHHHFARHGHADGTEFVETDSICVVVGALPLATLTHTTTCASRTHLLTRAHRALSWRQNNAPP